MSTNSYAAYDTNEKIGFVSSPNNRDTLGIIWNCLSTVFVCTWTVLHLNVPPPGDSYWSVNLDKVKWMVITIIAPEILVDQAAAEWFNSRKATLFMKQKEYPGWTWEHAFYTNMGGFVLRNSRNIHFPITIIDIRKLYDSFPSHHKTPFMLPMISLESIRDRSKSNGFATLVSLIQGGWLVAQIIARAAQKLPISLLEISTTAFFIGAIIVYALQWNKPLDIQTSTPIPDQGDAFFHFLTRSQEDNKDIEYRLKHQKVGNWNTGEASLPDHIALVPFAMIFGAVHMAAWNYEFDTRVEAWLWRSCSLGVLTAPLPWVVTDMLDDQPNGEQVPYLHHCMLPSSGQTLSHMSVEKRMVSGTSPVAMFVFYFISAIVFWTILMCNSFRRIMFESFGA